MASDIALPQDIRHTERMSDGWVIAGTLGTWLALGGVGVAIYQIIAQRRRITVSLLNHSAGRAEDRALAKTYWVMDIVNAGGELAIVTSLQIVGGELVPNPAFPMKGPIDAGGSTRIWIDAPDPREVWFRYEWVTPRDGRFAYAAWRPMLNGDQTDISRKWDGSNLRKPHRNLLNRWFFDRWPQPVDPDHHAFGRILLSWNSKREAGRVGRLLPVVDGQEPQWKFGLMDPET